MPIARYDLAITHDWEYDRDFVGLAAESARSRCLETLLIAPADVRRVLD